MVIENYKMRITPLETTASILRSRIFCDIGEWDEDSLDIIKDSLEGLVVASRGKLVDMITETETEFPTDIKLGSSGTHIVRMPDNEQGETTFEIRYNRKSEDDPFPVFEVLHETWHAISHINEMEIGVPQFFGDFDWEDCECNLFARTVLMPAEEFVKVAKKFFRDKKYHINEITDFYKKRFPVHPDEINFRGRELGLWT